MEEILTPNSKSTKNKKSNPKVLALVFSTLAAALVFVAFVLALTVTFHEIKDDGKLGVFWPNAAIYLAFLIVSFGLILAKFILFTIPAFIKAKTNAEVLANFIIEIATMVFIILACAGLAMHRSESYYMTHLASSSQTACIVSTSLAIIPVAYSAITTLKDNK